MPTDASGGSAVLGPALRDVLTADGPVAERWSTRSAGSRRSLFSSAAQRALAPARREPAPPQPRRGRLAGALRLAAAAPPRRGRSAPRRFTRTRSPARPAAPRSTTSSSGPRRTRGPCAATAKRWRPRSTDATSTPTPCDSSTPGSRTVVDQLGAGRPVPILPLLGLVDSGRDVRRATAAGARRRSTPSRTPTTSPRSGELVARAAPAGRDRVRPRPARAGRSRRVRPDHRAPDDRRPRARRRCSTPPASSTPIRPRRSS